MRYMLVWECQEGSGVYMYATAIKNMGVDGVR